jgi:anaerobic selenocysteine-containing dehydrogenase
MSTRVSHSVCPLDCPDRCSLDVTVEDGRITTIASNDLSPITNGYICSKVRAFDKRLYGPDRLLYPMRRVGAKGSAEFERITWDEAIATIAERFQQIIATHGAEAILPYFYGGSNGLISEGVMDRRFFRRLGASRLGRTLCAAAASLASLALYQKMACADLTDFAHARCILIWGANPNHSNIHLVPYLREAKRRGATIALIDPRASMPDSLIDIHIPVYPGTDLVLALAMMQHIEALGRVDHAFLERHTTGSAQLLARAREFPPERAAQITRVPARDIERLAQTYAESAPAIVRCGWGLERNRNGDNAIAAVIALPAIAGKFGVRGGGYALSTGAAYRFDTEAAIGVPEAKTRVVNMSRLGRTLTDVNDPPVKAIYIYDCNPVVTAPDQAWIERGLAREDLFTVVHEQVMTDTARFADILLPATTFFEHAEISRSYGSYGLFVADPVIAPVGEARPNEVVFASLARAMGFTEPPFVEDTETLMRTVARSFRGPLATSDGLEALRASKRIGFAFPGATPVQFETSFPVTDDRKARLYPPELGGAPYTYIPDETPAKYPLALISPATSKTISSTLGEYNYREAFLAIAPSDAAARKIASGDWVTVHNALGSVVVRAEIDEGMMPGVVCLPKGFWKKATKNGMVTTALVPDAVTAASGNACYNDARVEVGLIARP